MGNDSPKTFQTEKNSLVNKTKENNVLRPKKSINQIKEFNSEEKGKKEKSIIKQTMKPISEQKKKQDIEELLKLKQNLIENKEENLKLKQNLMEKKEEHFKLKLQNFIEIEEELLKLKQNLIEKEEELKQDKENNSITEIKDESKQHKEESSVIEKKEESSSVIKEKLLQEKEQIYIKEGCIQAKEHLNNYFLSLKTVYINKLLFDINKIESEYEKSYNRNMDILQFIQKIIDNYDDNTIITDKIIKGPISIYKCDNNSTIDDLIKYYNEYTIIQTYNTFALSTTKPIIGFLQIKTINTTERVNSLLLLKDKRIATCSQEGIIKIFNPFKNYHCDEVIETESKTISSICQLDNGTIVSSSYNKSIQIGAFIIKEAHNDWINKVITLPNNRIASCSNDKTIKIWKTDPLHIYSLLKKIEIHCPVINIIYIKERDLMICGSFDGPLQLWYISSNKCLKVIKNILCSSNRALYQMDKERILVGGYKGFSIINIDKCIIEKTIKDESIRYVYSFLKLKDDNTILCGSDKGTFLLYDMKKKKYSIILTYQLNNISDLISFDDKHFLLCSSKESTIKLWEYYIN